MFPCEMARYIAGFSREARKSGPFPGCQSECESNPALGGHKLRFRAITGLGDHPAGRYLDHFDPAIPEPVDAADHLELTLRHRRIQDRSRRTELGNIVDHVLPGRISKKVTRLTRYLL